MKSLPSRTTLFALASLLAVGFTPGLANAESGGRLVPWDRLTTSAVEKKQEKKAETAQERKAREKAEKLANARADKLKAEKDRADKLRAERALARAKNQNPQPVQPVALAATGNQGELRSETQAPPPGLFGGLFGGGGQAQMLPQTRALDAVMEQRSAKSKFKVKSEFEPQSVSFNGYERGTIVIDTSARYLYLVESGSSARRYAIAVGRDGLQFKGTVSVGDKQEWPRWIPTVDMQKREPKKYGQYKDGMDGGPDNPLGARAMYLYQGKKDTYLRIHGTNQPQSIGTASSNGCFRMVNDHVIDLYRRVKVGTKVVVI